MQCLNPSQNPGLMSRLSLGAQLLSARNKQDENCGWFDSSFDLSQGLDVSEQDNDMLYQLWALSQP